MRTSLPTLGISTRRTFLRPLNDQDLQELVKLHNDPTTRQYAWVDNLQTPDENLEWIHDQNFLYHQGFGLYAIENQEEHKFLGLCGLRVRRDLGKAVDIVYRILPEYRHMGYATEAARAMLSYGFEGMQLQEIIAQVHRHNHPSRRIMYRLGFEPEDPSKHWILYRKNCNSSF